MAFGESSRLTYKKGVQLEDGSIVEVEVIYQIAFVDQKDNAQVSIWAIDNSDQSSRMGHLYTVNNTNSTVSGRLLVERPEQVAVVDPKDFSQVTLLNFTNNDPPPRLPSAFDDPDSQLGPYHIQSHVIRYAGNGDNGGYTVTLLQSQSDLDATPGEPFVDVEMIDQFANIDQKSFGQVALYTLTNREAADIENRINGTDPNGDNDVLVNFTSPGIAGLDPTSSDYEAQAADSYSQNGTIDPPWRLDPFQNIINVGTASGLVIGGDDGTPHSLIASTTDGNLWQLAGVPGSQAGSGCFGQATDLQSGRKEGLWEVPTIQAANVGLAVKANKLGTWSNGSSVSKGFNSMTYGVSTDPNTNQKLPYGTFVWATGNGPAYSTDGFTWKPSNLSLASTNVSFCGGFFFAGLSTPSSPSPIAYSQDGIHWNFASVQLAPTRTFRPVGPIGTDSETLGGDGAVVGFCYDKKRKTYYAAGSSSLYGPVIWASVDGRNWSIVYHGMEAYDNWVFSGNYNVNNQPLNDFVASLTFKNGLSGIACSDLDKNTQNNTIVAAGQWFVVYNDVDVSRDYATTHQFIISTNGGVNWAIVDTLNYTSVFRGVTWKFKKFWAVGWNYVPSDGTSPFAGNTVFSSATWTDPRFIADVFIPAVWSSASGSGWSVSEPILGETNGRWWGVNQ
jgi:hypothetical protein